MMRFQPVCSQLRKNLGINLSLIRNFSANANKPSNVDLQKAYSGILPRIITVSSLLNSDVLEDFNKIKVNSIIKGKQDTDNILRQLISFADLKVII